MLKNKNISVERLLIILIVIVAAFLRFWNFGNIPFMHDEFSAIFRTWYDSLSEVIRIGVKQNDTHPAGVQIFIYFWNKLFGLSEPVLKFPFALMGVGSVYLSWLVARRWFNESTALFTALILAITQYNIFYSQLARPYAPGLFFTLLTVWFWTKVVFDKPTKSDWLWFMLTMAVNSYIHAFTLFFNLLAGVTGLFFVSGQKRKQYLLAGVAIFVLFLPGVPVFLAQLGRGDIGGWLAPPKPEFLFDYFFYIFHFSRWFLITTVAITLYLSVRYYYHNPRVNRFRIIGVSWFLITFLTACLYSVYRSPIIQYSTLLFVFPFLLMVFFSFFNRLPKGTLIFALALVFITGTFTLIFERDHYRVMYHQGFDQIPAHVLSDLKSYNNEKVAVVLQSPDTRMFDYYFKKYGEQPAYFKVTKNKTVKDVIKYLKKTKADVVLFGWADYAPLNFLESVKGFYPHVEKKMEWFNSEYWVLRKHKLSPGVHGKENRILLKETGTFFVEPENRYGNAVKLNSDTLNFHPFETINVRAEIVWDTLVPDASLVFDWRDEDGNVIFWSSAKLKDYFVKDVTSFITLSLRLSDLPEIPEKSELKFYLWKRDKSRIWVRNMEVYITPVPRVEQGLYENLHE